MNITGICTYETPCGWCTKWDKKCDKKIGSSNPSNGAYDELFPCGRCVYNGNNPPKCVECSSNNGFKHFKTKEK